MRERALGLAFALRAGASRVGSRHEIGYDWSRQNLGQLGKLKLTATALKLERGAEGQPVWKVRLWAAKRRQPGEDADLGEVSLWTEDGTVVKNDLRSNRVD